MAGRKEKGMKEIISETVETVSEAVRSEVEVIRKLEAEKNTLNGRYIKLSGEFDEVMKRLGRQFTRDQLVAMSDDEAMDAFVWLSRAEGIVPAFESAHAIAYLKKIPKESIQGKKVIISLSGRGDKDMIQAMELLKL